MESHVSGLAKFGLGKSMDLPNLDLESHAMGVTCIIKLIILQTTHNIFHISYHVVNIILSYSMRPWNHRLDIMTSLNEGSTYGTLIKEPTLANSKFASYIHMFMVWGLNI